VEEQGRALLELGRMLQRMRYHFVAVTPETHRRVDARAKLAGRDRASSLREVFGWNRCFEPELLPLDMLDALRAGELLSAEGSLLRSRVRFATLRDQLFAHSAFPTSQVDAVFFGPDTYRFCALCERWGHAARRIVDVGCGSGAGGIAIGAHASRLVLADVSSRALSFAEVNAALNGVQAEIVRSDVLAGVDGPIDLVIANPPYMRDEAGRIYRDGGGAYGEALAVRIVSEALDRLSPSGILILYTGTAVVTGEDSFWSAVEPVLRERAARVHYEELDPDVFGEELERSAYSDVERIAVVGLRASPRRGVR
jgi:methylase of polypeptide subunit release factors